LAGGNERVYRMNEAFPRGNEAQVGMRKTERRVGGAFPVMPVLFPAGNETCSQGNAGS
jgi:hypothetical protein